MLLSAETDTSEQLSEVLLAEHRPVLFRYALLQLKDSALADDAVQETLLAAWQAAAEFAGKAGLRTWLIGILKHKIADHWRRNSREVVFSDFDQIDSDTDEADEDAFFMSDGHWNSGPSTWSDPERRLNNRSSGTFTKSAKITCRRKWPRFSCCVNWWDWKPKKCAGKRA
jgi:RNA polymerase sigma-70 factor (ECF subfamily)